jgi:hypothetical protein
VRTNRPDTQSTSPSARTSEPVQLSEGAMLRQKEKVWALPNLGK